MNERIEKGREMIHAGISQKDIINRIAEKMLETRPKCVSKYRPYISMNGVSFSHPLGNMEIDLNKVYPKANIGEKACIDFNITVSEDNDIFLNIYGEAAVYYNNKLVFEIINGKPSRPLSFRGELYNIPIRVRSGNDNCVRLICTKTESSFGCGVNLSVKRYPGMWASDYLYHARVTSPIKELRNESGIAISELFSGAPEKVSYCYPKLIRSSRFDFNQLCGRGNSVYVYTKVKKGHQIKYNGTVDRILINGKKSSDLHPYVDAEDELLFRCTRFHGEWFFDLDDENVYIPDLESHRHSGDKSIFIGPLYSDEPFSTDLSRIWKNDKGEKLFWRFNDGSQLRIYIDSAFFGQWFYAHMVGFYGIRCAGTRLHHQEYVDLFHYNMNFMAKYFEYIQFDIEKNIMPTFMPRIKESNVLDNLGTMGMNFIDSYFDTKDSRLLEVIQWIWEHFSMVPVTEDNIYYRIQTIWADDLYMSCPFIVRFGLLKNDKKILYKAAEQIHGFAKYLYDENHKLFSHIYFVDKKTANHVFWGRGNGWVMWTLTEVLPYIKDTDLYDELLQIFCDMSKAIRENQQGNGLWCQVINCHEKESYTETSCTAMFLLAFIRGIKSGWLDESYMDVVKKAWHGLLSDSIDCEGNVYGVCMGSECSMDKKYYFNIPTIINDDHGTGIVLAAASELYELNQLWESV